MDFYAIDPGARATGVALFSGGYLAKASLVRAEDVSSMIYDLHRNLGTVLEMVIERPTVYSKTSKGDPADLIQVALVAGSAATRCAGNARFVEPRTWKGQTPKDIHHGRIRAALVEIEKKALIRDCRDVPASLQHNVLDAVGLGLWHLGRLR